MSRLKSLTYQFKNDPDPNYVTYKVAYKGTLRSGESLDIFEGDWQSSLIEDVGLNILKFAVNMAFDIVLKVKDVASFVKWMQLLEPLFARNAPACLWFIKYMHDNKFILEKLLLEDPNFGVRE